MDDEGQPVSQPEQTSTRTTDPAPQAMPPAAGGETTTADVPSSAPTPAAAAVTAAAGPRRTRRWRRRRTLVVALLAVVLLLVGGTAGAGWYFSGQLLVVDHTSTYPETIVAVAGNQVTLSRSPETEKPALVNLVWDGGAAVLDGSVRVTGDRVVRRITSVLRGTPQPGTPAGIWMRVYESDPKTSRGLDYEEVMIPGELGDMPAWYVPPTAERSGTVWTIAVHGRGGTRHEALRILPTIAAAGLPTLVTSYRNDQGAPASPDGYYHLGDSEWRDVAAAIRYARDHGATGVVLYGWSMGGGASLMALRRMPADDAALVRAMVLDSPVVSWSSVLDLQGARRHLPGFLVWTAERFVEPRADLSLPELDHRRYADQFAVPMLVLVDEAERDVPTGPAHDLARARPNLVTLVSTDGGGHTGSWNVDPARYETAVADFLTRFRG